MLDFPLHRDIYVHASVRCPRLSPVITHKHHEWERRPGPVVSSGMVFGRSDLVENRNKIRKERLQQTKHAAMQKSLQKLTEVAVFS